MIYDCFMFFGEFDLLDLRLSYLEDTVDHFVIAEAGQSHSGTPKPLFFGENIERYNKFTKRITYVEIPKFPDGIQSRLDRDQFQRECMSRALTTVHDDDIVVVSDLDEIPDKKHISLGTNAILMNYYLPFWMNTWYKRRIKGPWSGWSPELYPFTHGSIVMDGSRFKNDFRGSVQFARNTSFGQGLPWPSIPAAGWHFSWQGGASAIYNKIKNFAHPEFDTPEWISAMQEMWEDAVFPADDPDKIFEIDVWKPNDPRFSTLSAFFTPELIEQYFVSV